MAINTLEVKFQHELGGIYDAEHQFLEAQQTMLESAHSGTVKAMLEKHIAETEQQIANLAQVYEIFGLSPERITCAGAKGIVTEGIFHLYKLTKMAFNILFKSFIYGLRFWDDLLFQ